MEQTLKRLLADVLNMCAVALVILAGAMVGSLLRGLWFLVPWLGMEAGSLALAWGLAVLADKLDDRIYIEPEVEPVKRCKRGRRS